MCARSLAPSLARLCCLLCHQPGNFLLVDDGRRLLLNDFDISATAGDASNDGFQSGTPRFQSPYLADAHTYTRRDDFISLIFTVVELAQKSVMNTVNVDRDKKLRLLEDLQAGRVLVTPRFQAAVAMWLSL